MKILHVVGSYYPAAAYGGPVVSTRGLCSALAQSGEDVTVLTTDADGAQRLPAEWRGWREVDGCRVLYGARWFPPDLSPGLFAAIRHQVKDCVLVHATGTYNWFLVFLAAECRRRGVPLVVSPRGSLMAAARQHRQAKKALFDLLCHRRALARVSAFHATSDEEAKAILAVLPGVDVAIVPNGVAVPHGPPAHVAHQGPYVLYLGRLHPFKRVDRIINSFARARTEPAVELWIAGDGSAAYREELERTAAKAGVGARTRFLGPVAGLHKTELLAAAQALVLASASESFGMSVAEALAHGTPCVVAQTAPWKALEREECGFWVEDTVEALAEGIGRLLSLPPGVRDAMGARGRQWMMREYSWAAVAKRMLLFYESVAAGR
jgi:glycosyltransferase involved in cell wall biosynthesis